MIRDLWKRLVAAEHYLTAGVYSLLVLSWAWQAPAGLGLGRVGAVLNVLCAAYFARQLFDLARRRTLEGR